MEELKLTVGAFELTLYALIRDALNSGVRESDIWAGVEAAIETAHWVTKNQMD